MNPIIRQAMDNAGIRSVAALSRISGVAYGTTYDFCNGTTDVAKMNITTLVKLCNALRISAEDLYQPRPDNDTDKNVNGLYIGATPRPQHDAASLSDDERRLIDIYRRAHESQRPTIIAVAEAIASGAVQPRGNSTGA